MNSYQRAVAALEGGVPDRLPVMETIIDWKVMRGLGYTDYFQMIEDLDLDAVSVNQVQYDPANITWWDESRRLFKDAWGVTLRLTEETWPIAVEHPLEDPDDFPSLVPPDPRDDDALKVIPRLVKRYKGRRLILMIARGGFVSSWMLRGMSNLFLDYMLRPELALELGRTVLAYNTELHRLAIEAGVDLILLGDDYAHTTATIMSPEHFRRFILPRLSEAVAGIRSAGGYCIKHSDGNVWKILEGIAETGVHGVGPLEPEAGMELAEVKRLYPGLCVMGNVGVDLLSRGSREEVRGAVERLVRTVSPGGGHILSSGNSISSSVKPENFVEMIRTARRLGVYPIEPAGAAKGSGHGKDT